MASRQNQGLQISLIFFVVMTILLSVVVYFTATSSAEKVSELEAKSEELANMRAQKDAYSALSNLLMAWIGDGEWSEEQWQSEYESLVAKADPSLSSIVENAETYHEYYVEDMYNFSAAYDGAKGWRMLPGELLVVISQKNEEISLKQTQLDEEKSKYDAERAANAAALAKANEAVTTLEAEKEQQRNEFAATSTQIAGEQAESKAAADEAGSRQLADFQTFTNSIATKDGEITRLLTDNQTIAARLDEYEREEFDIADGQITRINPRLNLVWLNLGSEDNLPRNAIFSIYGADSSSFKPDGKKGEIRIKRIMGPHSAEAEILVQDLEQTMMVGDNIFTPTWKPGRTMKYALAGLLDFDGDGVANALDNKRLKALIEQSGGEVVAEVDPTTGNLIGEIDALTNFVVVSDGGSAEDPAVSKAITDATSDLVDRAQEAGVQTLYLSKVLENFGLRDNQLIEKVGAGDGSGFAPRRPPARPSNDSAF